MLIQVPVEVTNFQPKADRSWKLQFTTQRELSGEEVKLLADNYMGLGHLLFSPNPKDLAAADVPKEPVEDNSKTPSQRLRAVIHVLYEQRGKPGSDAEAYYRQQMERFIDAVKQQLEPEES